MDRLSDTFSRIQVAIQANKQSVIVLNSKFICRILDFILKEGFIYGYKIINKKEIIVYIKYINNQPYFRKFERISTQGRKVYVNYKDLKLNRKYRNFSFGVLNTTKGLLSVADSLSVYHIGGELLFNIVK